MEAPNNFPPILLEVKTARGRKFILASEITYIKGSSKHCYVYFSTHDPMLEVHCLLKWFSANLPALQYCRCHDSYIVNFQYYDCINGNNVILKDNTFIPVSPKRKASCIQMLKQYLLTEKMMRA